MNKDSRTKNSLRNIFVGIAGQVLTIFLNFFSRSVFISILGTEYLGVNGLFSNILTILSLAELGVGSAIVYSMYKPIAENDKNTLNALMNLYSKSYKIVGVSIAGVGVLIIPFMDIIIKDNKSINNLTLIYLLFLCNTVVSYFYSYKRSIITADQREYINSMYRYSFNIIKIILQIIILYLTRSFILYLIIQIFCTLCENIAISIKSNKLYPFIIKDNKAILEKSMKRDIFKNIKALMIYKVCSIMLDGTDNIIISAFVGVASVGLLSNYTLIIGSVSMILNQIFTSITASVGNVIGKEDNKKQEEIFYIIFFSTFLFYGFSSVCLLILLNPFITLWIGEQYVLSQFTVLVLVINFYIYGMQNAVWTYRGTMGLFVYGKYRPLFSAVINVITSVILVKHIGLIGVLLGTTITRVITNVWYDPIIIFKYGFKKSTLPYYKEYMRYFFILIVASITALFFSKVFIVNKLISFIAKILICILSTLIIFIISFFKRKEFKYLLNSIKSFIIRLKIK